MLHASNRSSGLWQLLVLVGLIAGYLPQASVAQSERVHAQGDGNAEAAAEQAIYLSELEASGRFTRLYSLMHPDSKAASPRSAVVGWYENDFAPSQPHPISEIVDVRFKTWTWDVTGERYRNTAEVDYVQPFGPSGSVTYREETVRLVEEDGEWRWFFGRSPEFVEEQISKYSDDTERETSRSSSSDRDSDRGGSDDNEEDRDAENRDGCEVVELYPGYPGYRGNITGLMRNWGGTGDYECLEVLERIDSDFSRSREDRLNRQAARELGISGTFEEWTWENWMMIEAERGLPSSCYTCLMNNGDAPINPEFVPESDDPRILLGFPGANTTANHILHERDLPRYLDHPFLTDDYVLRAAASFYAGDYALSAPETLEVMYGIVESMFEQGGQSLEFERCRDTALSTGGYVGTSRKMHVDDQIFVMWLAYFAASTSLIPTSQSHFMGEVMNLSEEWQYSGSRLSLAEYMREELGM